jgi:hypothetical protein
VYERYILRQFNTCLTTKLFGKEDLDLYPSRKHVVAAQTSRLSSDGLYFLSGAFWGADDVNKNADGGELTRAARNDGQESAGREAERLAQKQADLRNSAVGTER